MFDYVDEIINAFDKAEPKGGGTKSSAAPDDLFKVNEDREKLIREPEIAECSKNARICNILLEIFHIFFIFHKENYFSIFVFIASVNLSICTNKSSFHNYFYTYPLFF
jgi:hypothetical protein